MSFGSNRANIFGSFLTGKVTSPVDGMRKLEEQAARHGMAVSPVDDATMIAGHGSIHDTIGSAANLDSPPPSARFDVAQVQAEMLRGIGHLPSPFTLSDVISQCQLPVSAVAPHIREFEASGLLKSTTASEMPGFELTELGEWTLNTLG